MTASNEGEDWKAESPSVRELLDQLKQRREEVVRLNEMIFNEHNEYLQRTADIEQQCMVECEHLNEIHDTLDEHEANFIELQNMLQQEESDAFSKYTKLLLRTPEAEEVYARREELATDLVRHCSLNDEVSREYKRDQQQLGELQENNTKALRELLQAKKNREHEVEAMISLLGDEQVQLEAQLDELNAEKVQLRMHINALRGCPNAEIKDFALGRDKMKDSLTLEKGECMWLAQEVTERKRMVRMMDSSSTMLDAELDLKYKTMAMGIHN